MKFQTPRRAVALAVMLMAGASPISAEEATDKKLKVVILMGQSNMVGYAHPGTAWYLTQPVYAPPAIMAEPKAKGHSDGLFYWSGLRYAKGDSKEYNARGPALVKERQEIIKLWRTRVYANFSRSAKADNWNYKEWGDPPDFEKHGGMRRAMGVFLSEKIRDAGINKRIYEYIDSKENKFHPSAAIKEIPKRDEPIADDLKRVREIFIPGAKVEDFDKLDAAIASFGRVTAENRMEYTKLVNQHIKLPIPERTHISALGAVAGQTFSDERQAMSQGPLSLGYTKLAERFGPEYPFGVSFERLVDGPVLLIKCAWGGKSLRGEFRPPSLHSAEEPTGLYWKMSMDHVKMVLSDLGQYHPDYNPKAGHELAGLVWFQGWNDKGNEQYGEHLVHFIKDVRNELKAPKLPVVCGLLGHDSWPHMTFSSEVNGGMLKAASHPDLKGTVDIVNSLPYYPIEHNFMGSMKRAYGKESKQYQEAERAMGRAISKDGVHYHGSAKFYFLLGDAMARKLANLHDGGEPTIHEEAKALLK